MDGKPAVPTRHTRYSRYGVVLVLCMLSWSCAGSQSGPDGDLGAGTVEFVVANELDVTITAYVEWLRRRPLRLSEVRPGETATFVEPIRGQEVRVVAGRVGRAGGTDLAPGFAPVRDGDRILWRFTRTGPRPFQRIPSSY